jgi:AbrB family transcriptional regulator, transcriptional pleiotropic regulator of transition state genes
MIERRLAMHDTGIVRKVDDLGRIVIPMELRRTLGIKVKDPIAIYVEGDRIILTKHKDACAICGATDEDMTDVKGRRVCATCVATIRR